MEPITRSELFMATAAGEYSGELPEPVTRSEFYLQKIAQRIDDGSSVSPEAIDAAIEAYLNSHDADIVTEAELIEALGGYYNKGDIDTALDGKADVADILDVSSFIDADVDNLTNYYDKNDVDDALSGKADANHNHSGVYAPASHSHTQADVTGLDSALAGKAAASHSHDDRYYTKAEADTSLSGKSDTGHLHDDRYYTETETDTLLAGKSNTGHTHDDRYYTESEIDTLLSGKADGSDIPDVSAFITKAVNDLTNYYTKSETYTQTEIDNMVSAIPKFAIEVVSSLPSQNISPTTVYLLTVQSGQQGNMYDEYIHVGNSWELLGTQTVDLSGYYTSAQVDALLSGLSVSGHTHDNRYYTETEIDGKVQEINSAISGKAAASHTHDDRYYTETEMDTALSGKSNTGHSHAVTDVTGLESALAGKAAASHVHDDRYYTESETDTLLSGKAAASHTHTKSQITDLSSLSAASGGTATSLCTTGEKYTWNNKAASDHNHDSAYAAKSHTHSYAGASSVGGSATSAVKLDTSTAGSAAQPCYFANGKPSACTYSLNKTVPADAKFTDTVYTHPSYTARTGKPTANQTPAFGGSVTVSQIASDASGHVTGMTDRTIRIPDAAATQSAAGLMSAADKEKLDKINIVVLTQAQYDAIASPDSGTLYLIPEASA